MARQCGADRTLAKPFKTGDLVAAAKALVAAEPPWDACKTPSCA